MKGKKEQNALESSYIQIYRVIILNSYLLYDRYMEKNQDYSVSNFSKMIIQKKNTKAHIQYIQTRLWSVAYFFEAVWSLGSPGFQRLAETNWLVREVLPSLCIQVQLLVLRLLLNLATPESFNTQIILEWKIKATIFLFEKPSATVNNQPNNKVLLYLKGCTDQGSCESTNCNHPIKGKIPIWTNETGSYQLRSLDCSL